MPKLDLGIFERRSPNFDVEHAQEEKLAKNLQNITSKPILMLQALPKKGDKIFGNVNPKTPMVCLANDERRQLRSLRIRESQKSTSV